MKVRTAVLAMSALALSLGACAEPPTAPESAAISDGPMLQRPQSGTGLALESFTQGLPLVGDVQVTEVVITEFSTFLGGLQASGTITGTTVDVLGNTITVTEDFTTDVLVSSSGSGRCGVVQIDLAPVGVDLLGTGEIVEVDIPQANVSANATGAIGPLLCALGSVVSGVAGTVVGGLINALNALLTSGSTPAV